MITNFSTVVLGRFSWDVKSRELYHLDKDGEQSAKQCVLTPKQHQLLTCLMDAYPNTLKKDQIIEKVWGSKHISQESLPQLINRTRQSLEDGNKSILVNEPGIGYSLNFTHVDADSTDLAPKRTANINEPYVTSAGTQVDTQTCVHTVTVQNRLWCALFMGLLVSLVCNLWELATAVHYQQDFLDVLNANPYPAITQEKDKTILLTIDNHECTYYKTQLLLQCV